MNILNVGLYDNNEPLNGLRSALSRASEKYAEISFVQYAIENNNNYLGLDEIIINMAKDIQADLVFMHLQSGEPVKTETINKLKQNGHVTIGFTGDVRQPLPEFYYTLGRHLNLSLFTNYTDVNACAKHSINADFIHVGYDDSIYTPIGELMPDCNDIVFMGNNYTGIFPLSKYREDIVYNLNLNFSGKVSVFGSNWEHLEHRVSLMYNHKLEASAYRKCKIAINCSHYDLPRYSSDRLNRILGSGAFCLSQRYEGIEQDFIEGKEIECFSNIIEMTDKIRYYLDPVNESKRLAIAKAGHEKMKNNFTWDYFTNKLIQLTKNIKNGAN